MILSPNQLDEISRTVAQHPLQYQALLPPSDVIREKVTRSYARYIHSSHTSHFLQRSIAEAEMAKFFFQSLTETLEAMSIPQYQQQHQLQKQFPSKSEGKDGSENGNGKEYQYHDILDDYRNQ